ncbi:GntR family transcriptional regulator [Hydrogenophaga sp.]|uniref:GntR family transcriptional regulator n=1 Tax=Hydrogenophaga sp. TaxID=1904254 RepID=UPI002721A26D|nr:GntR family transcriptional regulator [Hydrogenophaga sp.]MDO9436520.1 GntR family transcriptional regulator [Hydrogenophaga sp.]
MSTRNAVPQYRLLADHLIQRIHSGDLPLGSLLPTEQVLGEQFRVSRITVRGALRELELQGLIDRRPGIGSRVQSPPREPAFAALGDTVDDVLEFTKDIPLKVLSRVQLLVTAAIAADLGLRVGESYVRFEALRKKPRSPAVVYSQHYVPSLFAPTIAQLADVRISFAQWLAQARGHEVQGIDQEIVAIALTEEQARHLDCAAGAPALRSRRWYYGGDDTPLLVSSSVFPGDRYAYRSRLRRGGARPV